MRIAILCLEKGGGLSHCAYELAKVMGRRAEVTCFLTDQNDMLAAFSELPCRIRTFPLRRGPRALLRALITGREPSGLAPAILADQPDLLLDTGSGAWASTVLRPLGGRVPIAQIVHDVYPHADFRSAVDALPGMVRPARVDVFIGLSAFSFAQLARKYPARPRIQSTLGVLMSPGTVDPRIVASQRSRQLFVGRIHPYKGLEILVEAFAITRRAKIPLELTIVGRGTIRKHVRRRIRELGIGLDNRYLSDDGLKEVIASHGVMILPYTSATQSGIAAIGLAYGMPCIATPVGGLPEQVIHGSNGLLVPPRDPDALAGAMIAIATNEAEAQAMSAASLRLAREQYAWGPIGERLLTDLEAFLASRAGQPGA